MKKIFALICTIIIVFSLVACSEGSDNQASKEKSNQEGQAISGQEQPTEQSNTEEPVDELSMVDSFIEEYNATAPTPITDAVEINVTDRESGTIEQSSDLVRLRIL